jgi:hypothetical protein
MATDGYPMTNPLDFLILCAATYSLAWFVTRESGPFGIAARLRKVTTLGGLLDCWKCAGFWAGALMLLCWYWNDIQPLGTWFVLLWAVRGGMIMLASWTGANHD